jgi:hypothetical protein
MTRDACVLLSVALLWVSGLAARPGRGAGQAASELGTVDFAAQVTPTSGRTEPVRAMTFFLLRKSFHDVTREVEKTTPKPDLDAFVDRLEYSKELKAWMKKNHSVTVIGPEFRRRLTPDDILGIPEFRDAYIAGNASAMLQGFPEPKYHEKDREKKPEKYAQERALYFQQLRKYLVAAPKSEEAMDIILEPEDKTAAWRTEEVHWLAHVRSRALALAQTQYLAAKTETDLKGRGSFQVLPGTYWISTLEDAALGGELRLRWDVPVAVGARMITRVELSNVNASSDH